MECEKIQTFLSEYLDKGLDENLSKTVRSHLLECKACVNDYFSMKSAVEELAGLEKINAPAGFLNSINQAVEKRSWFKNIFSIFSGFRIPMEFVTLTTTAVLLFLIFTNLQSDKDNENRLLNSGPVQTALENKPDQVSGRSPVNLNFIMENRHASSDNVVTVYSEPQKKGDSITGLFNEMENSFPLLRRMKAISEINELIFQMRGDVVTREYQDDPGYSEIITIKIPSGNYQSFIDGISNHGNFEPAAPSLTDNPPDFVLLKMRLNLPE